MTPEEQDAINNLNRTIESLAGSATTQNEILRRMAQQQGVNVKDINDNLTKFGTNVNGASAATKSMQNAYDAHAKSMQLFGTALGNAADAAGKFSGALLDSTRNFSKYNSALASFGDALKNAGDGLGGIWSIAGTVVKGLTMVGQAALKQADNVNKAYDDLAKVGGAGGLTTKEIMNMGLQAGLMSKDLGKFTSAVKANSTAIAGLGGSAADGMKIFGQMTAVGTDTIAAYSKLGISQEELIKTQSDYVALQMASGRSLKGELADRQKLQKASLEYQDNLLTLSQLTGEDVEGIKKKQQEAMSALNWQIGQRQLENKAIALEKTGTEEGRLQAKKIREEMENRAKGLQTVSAIGSKGLTEAVREIQTTGTATSKGAQAMIRLGLGPAIAEYNKTIKEGGDATKAGAKLQDAYNKAQNNAIDTLGNAAAVNKDVAESMDLNAENMQRGTAQLGKNLEEEAGKAKERVNKQKTSSDPSLDARAKLTAAEIKAGTWLEEFLAKVNPLMGGSVLAFVALSAAVGAATVALGKMAGKSTLGSIMPGGGGLFGGGKGAPGGKGGGALDALTGGGKGGAGGGNFLEGMASGLKAFADPRVALGAVGFGAAIAAIGAGLAGATWIMGKALPSLAEGLQPFEKLDGEKLVATGKGVAALGAGLAVFGVGGAAAGFGAIAASLSDSLMEFFGAKTPFKRIEEFSKLDINAKRTEANAKAFVAFADAMATSGVGSATASIGNAVSGIVDGIGKLFGNKDAVQKFVDFTKLDVDPERAGKLAEAFSKYAGAMASVSGVKAVGTAAASGGGSGGAAPSGGGGASSSGGGGGGSTAATAGPGGSKMVGKTASGGGAYRYEGPGATPGAAGTGSGNAADVLVFGSKSGSKENFDALGGDIKNRILAAAQEYNSATGKKLKINSARRDPEDQQRVWDESVQAGRPGKGPTGMPIAKPGSSKHERGAAVDIQNYSDSTAVALLNKQGLFQTVPKDPVHFEVQQARNGGIFSGPETGYMVALHGSETVVPNAKVPEMDKKSNVMKQELPSMASAAGGSNQSAEIFEMMAKALGGLESKFDELIYAMNQSNNTQDKILRYSKA